MKEWKTTLHLRSCRKKNLFFNLDLKEEYLSFGYAKVAARRHYSTISSHAIGKSLSSIICRYKNQKSHYNVIFLILP